MEKIIINPLTRISGALQIEVQISNHKVIDAKSSGMMFRGFEKILRDRSPEKAIYFTERICGICSAAHSITSATALENAYNITLTKNNILLRDFIHASEYIQNHIRHFYQFTLPDYVNIPLIQSTEQPIKSDYRLPSKISKILEEHYKDSITYSRLAHEMQSILGGKAPHNHGVFIGGISNYLDSSKQVKLKSILSNIKKFLLEVILPDTNTIAHYYSDYFKMGKGYGNFMTYGVFNSYENSNLFYVNPGIYLNGKLFPFNYENITENVENSWYVSSKELNRPGDPPLDESISKPESYTFIKAPRYEGIPMEVGPLARMTISGIYKNGISSMDRTLARTLELKKIINIAENMLDEIDLSEVSNENNIDFIEDKNGNGLVDTTRGSLGHWISIKDSKIYNYDIISPSTWNLSPEDQNGKKGPVEQSLIGTNIENTKNPVEIGRIVRSFDPCVSCATHIISDEISPYTIRIL